MQKDNDNKGGCDTPVPSTTNEPKHEPLTERTEDEKVIGIGMPGTPEEMERLKREAEKPDR